MSPVIPAEVERMKLLIPYEDYRLLWCQKVTYAHLQKPEPGSLDLDAEGEG